jgi:hypothetical protein
MIPKMVIEKARRKNRKGMRKVRLPDSMYPVKSGRNLSILG